jgi:hypothetical protein
VSATFFARAKGIFGGSTPAAEPAKPPAAVKKPAAHHAVSIAPGTRCCAEARELHGQRFLSREAPKLPLASCDRTDCTCRYEHHQDRRKGARRARDMGVAVDGWVETDKRTEPQRGRRKGDQRSEEK